MSTQEEPLLQLRFNPAVKDLNCFDVVTRPTCSRCVVGWIAHLNWILPFLTFGRLRGLICDA